MSEADRNKLPEVGRKTRRRLIFVIFTSPVAWFLHEMISLIIVGRGCGNSLGVASLAGLYAVSAVAILAAGMSVMLGYKVFRSQRHQVGIFSSEGWEPVQFLALFATFSAGLLLLNMIYFSVLPFLVEPCMRPS